MNHLFVAKEVSVITIDGEWTAEIRDGKTTLRRKHICGHGCQCTECKHGNQEYGELCKTCSRDENCKWEKRR